MKILALSDIHHNLVAVRKLRAAEKNVFDVILVAGDMGSESAGKLLNILATFQCPVLYVYGNWDHKLGYKKSFVANCTLLHSRIVEIGGFYFTGFAGCPTHWGKNPLASAIRHQVYDNHKSVANMLAADKQPTSRFWRSKQFLRFQTELRSAKREILISNRQSIAKTINRSGVDPSRCILVTHERLTKLGDAAPHALLNVYGHIHSFSDRIFGSTRYINVAALDRPVTVKRQHVKCWSVDDLRNLNAGNYAIIEIRSSKIEARRVDLCSKYKRWMEVENIRYNGIDWIDEEQSWTRSDDYPIIKHFVSR